MMERSHVVLSYAVDLATLVYQPGQEESQLLLLLLLLALDYLQHCELRRR